MKNKLAFLLLMLISMTVFSQARLNFSYDEIKEEFKDPIYDLTSNYDSDGDLYIAIFTSKTTTLYYFDENKYCVATYIFPDNEGILNYYVEQYNKKYVILSENKWRAYSNYGYVNIDLIFDENFTFFRWKE